MAQDKFTVVCNINIHRRSDNNKKGGAHSRMRLETERAREQASERNNFQNEMLLRNAYTVKWFTEIYQERERQC